jgi:hypothetical protein
LTSHLFEKSILFFFFQAHLQNPVESQSNSNVDIKTDGRRTGCEQRAAVNGATSALNLNAETRRCEDMEM